MKVNLVRILHDESVTNTETQVAWEQWSIRIIVFPFMQGMLILTIHNHRLTALHRVSDRPQCRRPRLSSQTMKTIHSRATRSPPILPSSMITYPPNYPEPHRSLNNHCRTTRRLLLLWIALTVLGALLGRYGLHETRDPLHSRMRSRTTRRDLRII